MSVANVRLPEQAAAQLVAAHGSDPVWLDRFSAAVAARRMSPELARVLKVWGLSRTEAARLFGVTRQGLSKWLDGEVPADRVPAVGDLAAATDLLTHYLRRDRIPAVVRRPAAALGGRNLLDRWATGDTAGVLAACEEMFDVTGVNGW
jgi:hypothetical protein